MALRFALDYCAGWDLADPKQAEEVELFYDAYAHMYRLAHSSEFQFALRLERGQIVTYDNHRVMHGRSAFSSSRGCEGGAGRLLHGGYVDWDEAVSAWRAL